MTSMKTKLIFLCALCTLAVEAFAQTPMERDALAVAAGNVTEAAKYLKNDYALMLRQYHGQFFAVVDGKIYDMRQKGEMKNGNVEYASDGVVVITYGLSNIAIKNYDAKDATAGRHISCCAIRTGTYDWNGVPLQLWDCGTVPTGDQLEQIKEAEAKERALIARQIAQAKSLAAAKNYTNQAKAIIWLQTQATNGSASAQYSLAEHYLTGQGCTTNRENAIYWFTQAANQGDMAASNKLSKLKSP